MMSGTAVFHFVSRLARSLLKPHLKTHPFAHSVHHVVMLLVFDDPRVFLVLGYSFVAYAYVVVLARPSLVRSVSARAMT